MCGGREPETEVTKDEDNSCQKVGFEAFWKQVTKEALLYDVPRQYVPDTREVICF